MCVSLLFKQKIWDTKWTWQDLIVWYSLVIKRSLKTENMGSSAEVPWHQMAITVWLR